MIVDCNQLLMDFPLALMPSEETEFAQEAFFFDIDITRNKYFFKWK